MSTQSHQEEQNTERKQPLHQQQQRKQNQQQFVKLETEDEGINKHICIFLITQEIIKTKL